MNEHSLDDLIIGDPAPVTKKSRSLLAIIALAVIIFLVGILLWKMISGSTEDDINLKEENQTTFVSPDLIPMDTPEINTKNNDLTPIKKERLPKKKPRKVIQKETSKKPTKVKVVVKKQVLSKITKPKTIQKPVVKKLTSKPKPKALFATGKSVYYIQIGAFNRDPNPKFLRKVENAGLSYVIHKNEKTRRVRVGPYSSYTEAKAALSDVNSSIGIAGFVVKQK